MEYLKSTDMLKVINIVAASWDEIAPTSLQLSWRKLLSTSSSGSTGDTAVDTSDEEHLVQDCATLFDELGMELTVDEVEEWLQSDTSDRGYTHLNDDEIIATVLNESEGDEAEETEPDSTPQTKNMSHSEAIKMFDGCMQYLQEQNEDTIHNDYVKRIAINGSKEAHKWSKTNKKSQITLKGTDHPNMNILSCHYN